MLGEEEIGRLKVEFCPAAGRNCFRRTRGVRAWAIDAQAVRFDLERTFRSPDLAQ